MRRAHIVLAAILLLHFVVAALSEAFFWLYVPDGPGLGDALWMRSPRIYWPSLMFLLLVWCVTDAKDRSVELPLGAAIALPFLFPIGVPYYYWKTYPRRAAIEHIGLFAVFVAACIAASWLGGKLSHYYYFRIA